MKRQICILLFSFISFAASAQTTLYGTFTVTSASGSGPTYTLTGEFNDGTGYYGGDSTQVGDRIFFMIGATCGELRIDTINAAGAYYLDVDVTDIDGLFDAPPYGIGVLSGRTDNYEFRNSTLNASPDLVNCIESRFKNEVDAIDLSIYAKTGSGTPGTHAKYIDSDSLGNSIISDDGSVATVAGGLAVNTVNAATIGDTLININPLTKRLEFRTKSSLLSGYITGSLTNNTFPIATGATSLGNSSLTFDASNRYLFGGTGAIQLPNRTTLQRSVSPLAGETAWNTTTSLSEIYNGSAWTQASFPVGTSSQTLRHDGSNWVASSFLYNSGVAIGIGTTSPGNTLDIFNTGSPQLRLSYNASNYVAFQANSGGNLLLTPTGGNVGVNTSPTNTFHIQPLSGQVSFRANSYGNATDDGGEYIFARAKGTPSSPSAVSLTTDRIFRLQGQGRDATTFRAGADISMFVDGTVSSGNVPMRITFGTVPVGGGAVPVERMRITSTGNVGIGETAPSAKLEINGDLEVVTRAGTGTSIAGWAADNKAVNITLGTGLSLASGILSATTTTNIYTADGTATGNRKYSADNTTLSFRNLAGLTYSGRPLTVHRDTVDTGFFVLVFNNGSNTTTGKNLYNFAFDANVGGTERTIANLRASYNGNGTSTRHGILDIGVAGTSSFGANSIRILSEPTLTVTKAVVLGISPENYPATYTPTASVVVTGADLTDLFSVDSLGHRKFGVKPDGTLEANSYGVGNKLIIGDSIAYLLGVTPGNRIGEVDASSLGSDGLFDDTNEGETIEVQQAETVNPFSISNYMSGVWTGGGGDSVSVVVRVQIPEEVCDQSVASGSGVYLCGYFTGTISYFDNSGGGSEQHKLILNGILISEDEEGSNSTAINAVAKYEYNEGDEIYEITEVYAVSVNTDDVVRIQSPVSLQIQSPDINADGQLNISQSAYLKNIAKVGGTFFTQTASATVANTTTETTLTSTGQGTLTVPADFFEVGQTYIIRARGYFSTNGTTPNLTLDVEIDGVDVATSSAFAVQDLGGLNETWELQFEFTVRSTGVSGTAIGQGDFKYCPVHLNCRTVDLLNTSTFTFDTTEDQIIDVTAEWGTASANNTITCTNLIIEVKN